MDWEQIYTTRLAGQCARAATDLGLVAITPFELTHHGEARRFAALFPSFGSHKGMLVCLSSNWHRFQEVAAAEGYGCAGLHPDHFSTYRKDRWMRVIRAWDWHGEPSSLPGWHSEHQPEGATHYTRER